LICPRVPTYVILGDCEEPFEARFEAFQPFADGALRVDELVEVAEDFVGESREVGDV
jgi:hypothetical protein